MDQETVLSPFARLLRQYRQDAGLSQEALAERARLSWRTISDLERGLSQRPQRHTLAQVAAALELTEQQRAAFEMVARRPAPASASLADRKLAYPGTLHSAEHRALLVGRTQDMALLERHLAGQGPPLLLLAGQPGIGKSRLLQEAAGRADSLGWRVLAGGCTPVGGQQPFAPLLQALHGALAERSVAERRADLRGCTWLVRLLPELDSDVSKALAGWTLPPAQERRLMFGAVGRFLDNVAGPSGTLLLLDDLQWAGPDALELLAALLQQGQKGQGAPRASLRVIGAYRDTEAEPGQPLLAAVAGLAEAQLVRQWPLRPLVTAEAQALVAEVLGELGQPQAAAVAPVVERAGGVPFFLVSFARSLAEEAIAEPGGPRVPWDLRASIQQRVAALPEPARAVLAVAAVVGRVAPRAVLLTVLAQPEPEGLVALEQTCQAGLLEEAGDDSYGFVHDVIHEVVEGGVGLARRRALHRQVATALEALAGQGGAPPVEALAYHFRAAGAQARAAVYLEQAGARAAARFAHVEAAAHYRELATCLEELGREADSRRAREQVAESLVSLAQYDAAVAELEQVGDALRAAGDAAGVCRVEVRIGEVYSYQGVLPAGIARLRRAMAELGSDGPAAVLAQAQYVLGTVLRRNGDPAQALGPLREAIDIAREAGEDAILIKAQTERAFALMMLGRTDDALGAIERTVWDAGPRAPYWTLSAMCWIYDERGEYAQMWLAAERSLAVAERGQAPSDISGALVRVGAVAFMTGDWSRARGYLQQSIALTDQAGITSGHFYAMPRGDLGCLLLAEGDYDEASRCFEAVLATFEGTDERLLSLLAHAHLAERDVLTGQPEAAVTRLAPLLDRPGVDVEELMVTQYVLPVLAWAQCELGALDEAAHTAAETIRRARRATLRPALVRALRVQALVLLAQERCAEAVCALEEGLALARGMPYPHGEGRLLNVYGRLHTQQGELAQAGAQLEEALTIFRRLGARPDSERAEQDLASLRP